MTPLTPADPAGQSNGVGGILTGGEDLPKKLRSLVTAALAADQPRQAQFFADKLLSVSSGGWYNALLLAKSHAACGEQRRAVLALETITASAERRRLAGPIAGSQTLVKSKTPLQPHAHVGGHIYHEGQGLGAALLGKPQFSSPHTVTPAPSRPPPTTTTTTTFSFDSPQSSSPNSSPPNSASPYPPTHLCIEAALISGSSLLKSGFIEEASQVLEAAFTFTYVTPTSTFSPLGTPLMSSSHPETTTINVKDSDDLLLHQIKKEMYSPTSPPPTPTSDDGPLSTSSTVHPLSRLCSLRALSYSELDNNPRAVRWFKSALKIDCRCVEAFEQIVERHLMTQEEEAEFIMTLDFGEETWLRDVYFSRLTPPPLPDPQDENDGSINNRNNQLNLSTTSFNTNDSPGSIQFGKPPLPKSPPSPNQTMHTSNTQANNNFISGAFHRLNTVHKMGSSPEILAAQAAVAYRNHRIDESARLCALVHRSDSLCNAAVCTRISCLVDLKRVSELFYFAHQLVDSRPRSAVSWFAVGAYYHLIGKNDVAQRHFGKASRMNPRFVEAWVAFGNAFAAQDESDQAMSAYRAAQRLFNGSHIPLLYIGMEYIRTNSRSLARHFLLSASNLNNQDPLAFNELGVVSYRQGEYEEAAQYFFHALRLCKRLKKPDAEEEDDLNLLLMIKDAYWEPTINNLGQCFRKLQRFEDAIFCLETALSITNNAGTRAALAFSKHLSGNIDDAIADYHTALSLKPDDAFSAEMLNKALEDSMNLGMPDDPNEDEFEVEDTNAIHSMNMNTLSSHGQDSVFSGNQSSVMDINESNDSFLDASEGASGSDDDVDMMSG
ncbi:hypothetical protein TrST_g11702 [Triparma strigata]|uniref:Anaphase-promoting complex subunit 6 n=1 Tax=Triparma strigata TaxID=1606541 RepID=A0A9W7EBK9_9STRA|nr:hypothetical protein TrST_g11702 [Triparma strigata]